MLVLLAGLLAGVVHVMSGPDHLTAVAPLALKRRRPWMVGLSWGIGHVLGVGLLSAVALLLREALPLEAISAWGERVVGVVLIAIGLWGLRSALRHRVHAHEHAHGGEIHTHIHAHPQGKGHGVPHAHRHPHAAFGIGALHGVAGTSHFLGVLPALALPDTASTLAYLGGYGAGNVAAMIAFAALVGLLAGNPSAAPGRYRGLAAAASAAAIGVGVFWLAG